MSASDANGYEYGPRLYDRVQGTELQFTERPVPLPEKKPKSPPAEPATKKS
jgi:hypothetical protein